MLGLDPDRFADDFASAKVARHIQDDRLDAEIMDLNSTPTFFVNGVRHIGPYDSATLIRALPAPVPVRQERRAAGDPGPAPGARRQTDGHSVGLPTRMRT